MLKFGLEMSPEAAPRIRRGALGLGQTTLKIELKANVSFTDTLLSQNYNGSGFDN